MRFTVAKLITVFVIILNVISFYFIWKLLSSYGKLKVNGEINMLDSSNVANKPMETNFKTPSHQEVTFVIRSFESFDHDIADTVKSVLNVYPNATVLVVTDEPLYPPVAFNITNLLTSNVKFVNLKPKLTSSFKGRTPTFFVKSKYIFFIPDSTRFNYKKLIETLVHISRQERDKLIAVPYKAVKCLKIHIDIREWYLRFDEFLPQTKVCDYIKGKHALFVSFENMLELPDPFMLPFPESLYIQAAAKNMKVLLADELPLSNGRELFKSQHDQWKVQQAEKARQKAMFQSLEIKKVVKETGAVEWYGCQRDTPRCFGSIIDETPQYLWEEKWTPPCCLAGLRRTARHVFEQLEEAHVRYWLEGGSLLGAMRGGDILPWDYDVDIGIYRDDIPRCTWLLRASAKPVTDTHGFVWEKAVEGDFFRVQFSQVNRLHVDIFPFYSRNGTMTKDTWFKTHRQDREFPEHFLRPLSTIDFVGKTVSAPNNIHDFLELKFGEGAIENPEYPNPYKMSQLGLPRGPGR